MFPVFKAATDFPAKLIGEHFNVKEAFPLHEALCLLVAQYRDRLSGTTLVVDVDNTTMFYAFREDYAGDGRTQDLIKFLF